MYKINGIAVKSGMAFMTKDGGRVKHVIGTVHRNGDISFLADKHYASFLRSKNSVPTTRVTFEKFQQDIFKSFTKASMEILKEAEAQRKAEQKRLDEVNEAHKEGLKMDILFEAKNGVGVDVLMARMTSIIEDEKDESWDSGYDEGKSQGAAETLYDGDAYCYC